MTPARLAIVDDDPAFSRYLATLLGASGYAVEMYDDGASLLRSLQSSAAPDVVLLDVLMPGMNGLETLRAARTMHPQLQVIMLSGSQAPATIVDAVRLGAVDYVLKPDDPGGEAERALVVAIRNAVEQRCVAAEVVPHSQISDEPDGARPCWGSGVAMRQVLTMVRRVAGSDVNVLVGGESGVGKDVIARELHRESPRRSRAFVKVNCAALPADLLESELFGHERGAFTGAQQMRVGKFEYANGGTIVLDEIGEMPLALQAKLLHVLQDREFTRLGSNRPVAVDVRVIACTNRALDRMIRDGQFREDLYYRLQVIELHVPPLRERRDEILPLTAFFLAQYAGRYGRDAVRPSRALRDALLAHSWPGNVRELENVIRRFVILRDEALVIGELARSRPPMRDNDPSEGADAAQASSPPSSGTRASAPSAVHMSDFDGLTLPDLAKRAALVAEYDAIRTALDRFRWNRRRAAQQLGVSYKTLLNKMKECGIAAPLDSMAE